MEGKQEQATIPGSEFFKSLGKLEAMAKNDDVEKAQLFHTKNSKRSEWEGGDSSDVGDNWDDSIGSDGTDYHPARKAVALKVLKGESLTADDVAILKSDVESSKDEKEKFNKEDMGKSLSEDNPVLQKGIEMSPFLAELVKAIDQRFTAVEERTEKSVISAANSMLENLGQYLEPQFEKQGEFNKSLAEVVAGIGHGLSANIQQTAEMAQAPAGAPKSALRAIDGGVNAIEKSFEGQGAVEPLNKSMVLSAMTDMVEKGNLNPLEVVKYENTGEIRPDLLQTISSTLSAASR